MIGSPIFALCMEVTYLNGNMKPSIGIIVVAKNTLNHIESRRSKYDKRGLTFIKMLSHLTRVDDTYYELDGMHLPVYYNELH